MSFSQVLDALATLWEPVAQALAPLFAWLAAVWAPIETALAPYVAWFTAEHWLWSVLGFSAAGMFTGRFVLQWYVSERLGKSVIPIPFWYMSFCGGVLYFIYALHLMKWPIIMMAFPTPFIAWRNLQLIRKHRLASHNPEEGTKILEEPVENSAPEEPSVQAIPSQAR